MTRRNVQIEFHPEQPTDSPPEISAPQMGARGVWFLWALLLVGLTLIAYLPSIRGSFIYGDDANLTTNAAIRSWRGLWAIWRLPHNFPQFSPIGYTTFALEYHLWGLLSRHAPWGYHATNIVLHAINALLLWTLARRLNLPGAWAAAAIFALHPLAVQSVSWISQRPTLLGMLFGISSLLIYLKFCGVDPEPIEPRPGWIRLPARKSLLYALALAFFLAAVLSDPALAVSPLVIPLIIWWKRERIRTIDLKPLIPLLIISCVALAGAVVLANRVVRASSEPIVDLAPSLNFAERMLIAGRAIWFYTASAIVPSPLSFAYPRWNVGTTSAWQWLFPVAVITMLLLAWRLRHRGVMASMLIFVIALLPGVLFIRPVELRGAFVADSLAYPALAAFVVSLVAWIADQLQSLRPRIPRINLAPALAAIAIIVMGTMSIQNQLPYRTTEQLWADTVDKFPRSTFALNRLGELELAKRPITQLNDRPDTVFTLDPVNLGGNANVARQRIIAKAEDRFRQALAIDPNDLAATVNLGRVYEARGEWSMAISQFYAARTAGARDVDVQFWLAEAFNGQGNSAEAIRRYQMVIQQDPNYDLAYSGLGKIYYQRNDLESAEQNFLAALRINPRLVAARTNLASIYFITGRGQEAQDEMIRAWQIEPNNAQTCMNIGSMLGATAESKEPGEKLRLLQAAEKKFREAVAIDNQLAEAWNNLGLVLEKEAHQDARLRGKSKEAAYCFARAAELEPDDARYKQNYESAKRESGLSQ